MISEWKAITYRGGLAEFRIPLHWVEEYASEDGGAFYDPTPGSDTLRLEVLTLRSSTPVTSATPLELVRSRAAQHGATAERLPSGNALIAYSVLAEEDGIPLVIYYWEVANSIPPAHARLAVFSLTTVRSKNAQKSSNLEWVDREVRALQFSSTLGEVAS
jgi:hypothetical protein